MSRAWFLGLLLFVALAGGLLTLRGAELALAVPILVYWAYALWRAPADVRLQVHRKLAEERTAPGKPVAVSISIFNAGDSLEQLAVEDVLPPGLEITRGSTRHLIPLARHEAFEFTYEVRGPRGMYVFDEVHAQAGDTLGLLQTSVAVSAPSRFLVLPSAFRLKPIPIRPRRTRVYAGTIPARVGGAGVEFFGVRPYEAGDAARLINWRAVGRHPDEIYSNEFQQERVADVAVVLDARQRSDFHAAGQSLFEYSVVAAGSLASAFLHQGNRVGLLIYSHYLQWTFPGYGKIQRERIIQALAMAAPGASQIFEGLQYLPTRLFPPESQIVLISPLLQDDLSTLIRLRSRGFQMLVICPDPVTFELPSLPSAASKYSAADALVAGRIVRLEREVLLRRLRRAGIEVIEWDVSLPFDHVVRAASRRLLWRRP